MKDCPKCETWTDTLHDDTVHWRLIEHPDPHPAAALHLMLVPLQHENDLLALSPIAQAEFWQLAEWARQQFHLTAYGLVMRCGVLYPHAYAEIVSGVYGEDASKVELLLP